MANIQQLRKKADTCLAKKVDIPTSPLWNMAKVAKLNATDDLRYLQEAVNYLTCKAKAKLGFSDDDKEFLKELYEAFWWGGHYNGYKEAAQLANHYVNGVGNNQTNPFIINPEVYKTSKIVIATMDAMKKFILEQKKLKKHFSLLQCDNAEFRTKSYAQELMLMDYLTEGKMKLSGVLEAAQNNQRLHKTDGHFYLKANPVAFINNTKVIQIIWSVDSLYDFEPFEKQNYYTVIPLGENKLLLPDGLSEYMVQIGVAKNFWYRAEWTENWWYE